MTKRRKLSRSSGDGERIVLSICMIVRDSARTLDACLASIAPWVDELVVVDTGSVDETTEIAKRYCARLFHFPWIDDFSAARNESLRHARGEWIFWMDSDDTIDEANGRKLRALAYSAHEDKVLGYVIKVHCPGADDETSDVTVVDHVKMFRNRPDLRFEGRIHEQVLMPIRRLKGDVRWTDIFVVHSGADNSPEGRKKKYERDLHHLRLDLEDRPGHPFVMFNLGMTYADMGDYEEAAQWLEKSLRASDVGESHVRKAFALFVLSLSQLGRHDDARGACAKGRELFPGDVELMFRQAILHHESGELHEAANLYRALLTSPREQYFSSLRSGMAGYLARYNLAAVYRDMGRDDLAEVFYREVLDDRPSLSSARRFLIDSVIRQGRLTTAQIEFEGVSATTSSGWAMTLIRARLCEATGNLHEAKLMLRSVVRDYPDRDEPIQELCRFLFERGEPAEAREALEELIRKNPSDGSSYHNLGQIHLREGNYDAAANAFQQSLRIRPHAPQSCRQLAAVLQALGRVEEANAALSAADDE